MSVFQQTLRSTDLVAMIRRRHVTMATVTFTDVTLRYWRDREAYNGLNHEPTDLPHLVTETEMF